jgi:hypothetical protein
MVSPLQLGSGRDSLTGSGLAAIVTAASLTEQNHNVAAMLVCGSTLESEW